MMKPPLVSASTLFSFVFLTHHITTAANGGKSPAPSCLGDLAINCGFHDKSTALDGREWFGEAQSLQPKGKSRSSTVLHGSLSADPIPYMTARISAAQFSYAFQVNPGQKFVRLHFYRASYRGFEKSQDFFTVKAGPFTLLKNFSASLAADSLGVKHIVKEFCLNVEENRKMDITFSSTQSSKLQKFHAFVNGIEIISMPTGLYYTSEGDSGAPFVGQSNRFYVDNSTAIETVQRLNIGGSSISPVEDFGMFRRWSEDTNYLLESRFQQPINHLAHVIKYSKAQAFIAPLKIYQTSRKVRKNVEAEEMHILTWKLPVDSGFGYLVRLHFCDFELGTAESGRGEFNVLINEQIAEIQANVIRWSGGSGIPVHRDYMVIMKGDKEDGKCDLSIALQSADELVVGLFNGLEIFKLSNPDNSLASPNPIIPQGASTSWNLRIGNLLLAFGQRNATATALTTLIILVNVTIYYLRQIYEENFSEEKDTRADSTEPSCRYFSLAEIISATRNFSESFVIGKGGFGKVYKCFIYSCPKILAIKRLKSNSKQGAHEFWMEIETLSRLRHIHLVSLIGYCNEGKEMILAYEYMPRGTLADNLYKNGRNGKDCIPLTWEQRLRICIGAARGLEYLHTGIEYGIIHRDVKDSNILLDENLVAKVSDFGLSKLEKINESHSLMSTKVKGTPGYLDPDYLTTHRPTRKADVYAFGIVLLVVLSGRPALDTTIPGEPQSLLSAFRECIPKGEIDKITDPSLQGKISSESLREFVKSIENCLQLQPKKRPTMAQVVVNLEYALELQHSTVSSTLEEAVVLGQPRKVESLQLFQFDQVRVSPILEETVVSPPEEGNRKKANDNNDLQTKEKILKLREKDRTSVQNPLRGWLWNIAKRRKSKETDWLPGSPNDHRFSLAEIKSATQNFSDAFLIGEGGLGRVYKGYINGGSQIVAIKQFTENSGQAAREFWTEIELLSKLRHKHIVSLLGYCHESNGMFLVYEYIPCGTLAYQLYGNRVSGKDGISLTWEQRLRICIGAARGLDYLHSGIKEGIIHRDVKDSNILLAENFVGKISAIRLSVPLSMSESETHISTRIAGTLGYLDPHYFLTSQLTTKSDVYSFGITLLVVLCGRQVVQPGLPEDQINLVSWFHECGDRGKIQEVIDPSLQGKISYQSLGEFVCCAQNCIHLKPEYRPTMAEVVASLERALKLQQSTMSSISEEAVSVGQPCDAGAIEPSQFNEDGFPPILEESVTEQ